MRVRGVPDRHALERLARGVTFDGRRTATAEVRLRRVYESESGPQGIVSLVIHEGRNRQVRKMLDAIGHPVVQLKRVRIGPISDDRLKLGHFRALTPGEIAALKKGAPGPEFKDATRTRLLRKDVRPEADQPPSVPRAPGPIDLGVGDERRHERIVFSAALGEDPGERDRLRRRNHVVAGSVQQIDRSGRRRRRAGERAGSPPSAATCGSRIGPRCRRRDRSRSSSTFAPARERRREHARPLELRR